MAEHERPAWSVSWDEGYEAGKRAERAAIVRYLRGEGADLYATLIEDGAQPKRPPELSPEERKKRADQRDRGVLNDGPGSPQWAEECQEFGCHGSDGEAI